MDIRLRQSGDESSTTLGVPVSFSFPAPTVSAINPSVLLAHQPTTALQVRGTGFTPLTEVALAGAQLPLTARSGSLIEAQVNDILLRSTGMVDLTVSNPAPQGGVSSPLSVSIENPSPRLSSLGADSISVTERIDDLDIHGEGFVPESRVTSARSG